MGNNNNRLDTSNVINFYNNDINRKVLVRNFEKLNSVLFDNFLNPFHNFIGTVITEQLFGTGIKELNHGLGFVPEIALILFKQPYLVDIDIIYDNIDSVRIPINITGDVKIRLLVGKFNE